MTLHLPKLLLLSVVLVGCCASLHEAHAEVLMEETFDTDAVDATDFGSSYAGRFGTYSDPVVESSISVSGGVLRIAHGAPLVTPATWTEGEVYTDELGGFSFEPTFEGITITADIGADSSFGDFNVGLSIGGNVFVFHPGFDGPPAGAFRYQNDPALDPVGNVDMGFTPSNGVMHQWEIEVSTAGDLAISITDGNNASNVFNVSYAHSELNNATNDILNGFTVGLYRAGGPGTAPHEGLYDNFVVASGVSATPGDFDTDGDVDGADLVLWQNAYGAGVGGDADGDGDTDGSDFLIWQKNLSPSPASAIASVPEPTTVSLAVLALTGALLSQRRRNGIRCN